MSPSNTAPNEFIQCYDQANINALNAQAGVCASEGLSCILGVKESRRDSVNHDTPTFWPHGSCCVTIPRRSTSANGKKNCLLHLVRVRLSDWILVIIPNTYSSPWLKERNVIQSNKLLMNKGCPTVQPRVPMIKVPIHVEI